MNSSAPEMNPGVVTEQQAAERRDRRAQHEADGAWRQRRSWRRPRAFAMTPAAALRSRMVFSSRVVAGFLPGPGVSS
jgi:hypothetical protein